MDIKLELRGGLKSFNKLPDNSKIMKLNLRSKSTISDCANQLSIPKEQIVLIIVNKKVSNFDFELRDGDRVVFYPPICGG